VAQQLVVLLVLVVVQLGELVVLPVKVQALVKVVQALVALLVLVVVQLGELVVLLV
jgi:hypothetical protein